ncbi:MAG: phosphoribosyltransferase [Chloroflexota bacterium]|nr:phosphoribosyltransferase [Chloroflexota bacterium]
MDMSQGRFRDRADAGRRLGERLAGTIRPIEGVVIGLARGGVPVAAEVAAVLALPLDVLTVRKLGVPAQPELAFGAIATGGYQVLNPDVVAGSRLAPVTIDEVRDEQAMILARREHEYRAGMPPLDVAGAPVILVDDGMATGATMSVAIDAVRGRGAARIVAAVPVAAPDACARVAGRADQMVCLARPDAFYAVGAWYEAFVEVSDDEVRLALRDANARVNGRPGHDRAGPASHRPISAPD